jgi:hypothetical protein
MHWHRARQAGGVLVAAGIALLVLARPAPPEVLPEAPDAGVVLEAPGVMTDAAEFDQWAALKVPDAPPKWQKTSCNERRREVSIKGGCYKQVVGSPPCAEGEFEHDGKCWVAVAKADRPATSIGQ